MPQLTRTTRIREVALNLRCPYQAKVMKTLDTNSSQIGVRYGDARLDKGLPSLMSGIHRSR
jgi:hypothetical protein